MVNKFCVRSYLGIILFLALENVGITNVERTFGG